MRRPLFTGAATAIVTPFTDEGVNLNAFRRLIDFQIAGDIDGIVALGTTGEASTQSEIERDMVTACAIEHISGRVPLIVGTGSNDTAHAIRMSKRAQELGADGLLVVTPYYNKTTQAGLIAHFTAIADAVSIPVIIYNVPSRTSLNMLPQTFAALKAHPNIWGVKEASGDITQITELARLCPELAIYSGNDDHVLPMLSVGGLGVITTVGNIAPREMHMLCKAYFDGDIAASRAVQFKVNPLVKALFNEVNPIPVKTALSLMGYDAGPLRLPLVPMTEGNLAVLKREMATFGLLPESN